MATFFSLITVNLVIISLLPTSQAIKMTNTWVKNAISEIEADFQRSADTHLIRLNLPAFPGIYLYLKDESTHPTGSLKHRLARSLFLYGLCNGWIKEDTTIIEASSGSTAVSEAYFARLIGLPFIAVMPSYTARRKVEQISLYGGRCHFVDHAGQIYAASEQLARELNGHIWTSSPMLSGQLIGAAIIILPIAFSAKWRANLSPYLTIS